MNDEDPKTEDFSCFLDEVMKLEDAGEIVDFVLEGYARYGYESNNGTMLIVTLANDGTDDRYPNRMILNPAALYVEEWENRLEGTQESTYRLKVQKIMADAGYRVVGADLIEYPQGKDSDRDEIVNKYLKEMGYSLDTFGSGTGLHPHTVKT
jgi:hypothetical protein